MYKLQWKQLSVVKQVGDVKHNKLFVDRRKYIKQM